MDNVEDIVDDSEDILARAKPTTSAGQRVTGQANNLVNVTELLKDKNQRL